MENITSTIFGAAHQLLELYGGVDSELRPITAGQDTGEDLDARSKQVHEIIGNQMLVAKAEIGTFLDDSKRFQKSTKREGEIGHFRDIWSKYATSDQDEKLEAHRLKYGTWAEGARHTTECASTMIKNCLSG